MGRNQHSGAKTLMFILCICLCAAAFSWHKYGSSETGDYDPDDLIWNVDHAASADKEVKQAVQDVIAKSITADMSDAQKVKVIHDYIVLNCAYDYENYRKDTIPSESFTPRGVLVNHIAVCEGYAAAFKAFMDELDIPCKVMVGTAGEQEEMENIEGAGKADKADNSAGQKGNDEEDTENHAWNIVCLDNCWYHVDVTFDDPVPDRKGMISYNYFLVPDSVISRNHWWDAGEYPACIADNNAFISLIGHVCNSGEEIENELWSAYQKKTNNYMVIVPKRFVSDYEKIYPYKWSVEEKTSIHLPDYVYTTEYGQYNIFQFVNGD